MLLRVPKVHPAWREREVPEFTPLVQDAEFMASLSGQIRVDLGAVLVQRPAYAEAFLQKQRTSVYPAQAMQDTIFLDGIRNTPENYSFKQVPEQQPFTKPALIVTGRQDTVTGYRDAWTLLEHYPRATYAVLDRAAHEWPLPEAQQQRLFAALINDWLDRIEETLDASGTA